MAFLAAAEAFGGAFFFFPADVLTCSPRGAGTTPPGNAAGQVGLFGRRGL
jgi:hypothetical protein